MMKQKLIALLAALALCLSLAGCSLSAPASVGRIGEVEIPSGLYLLYQHSAYQSAVGYAEEGQNTAKPADFLKQTITPGEDAEAQTVSAYVADRTQESLRLYAAVETRFAALGGELTAEQTAAADSYAQQLLDNDNGTYAANGIGLESLKLYERNLIKQGLLMGLVYGAEGEHPVADEELTAYLQGDLLYGYYTVIPLYDPNTFTFATDEQKAAMLAQGETVSTLYEAAMAGTEAADGNTRVSVFYNVLASTLPGIYAEMGAEYDTEHLTEDLYDDIFPQAQLDAYFSQEAADALKATAKGSVAAVQYTELGMMIFLRLDPMDIYTLDDLRDEALVQLKSDELSDELTALGQQLNNGLESSAMSKLPASRIVMG